MLLPIRVWRDPHRIQVGTDPDRAVVLEFADPACARILDLLDGTRTETRVLREAANHGIAAEDATAVLTVLRRAGYVVDAHALRAGRLTDTTRRRLAPQLTALALRNAGTGAGVGASAAIHRRQAAHLAVSVRDGTVVLGPLVRPGLTPCLNCLDLHRRDRDPGWPAVAEQIGRGGADAVEATTALAGAAYAAAEVLAHVDGALPRTLGATVEITTPGQPIRRQWTQHPECGCRRKRARPIRAGGCFN